MNILTLIQILIAGILIVVIILQNRGADSSMTYGGATQTYRSKKGVEQVLFYATIVLAAIFACISIISVLI